LGGKVLQVGLNGAGVCLVQLKRQLLAAEPFTLGAT